MSPSATGYTRAASASGGPITTKMSMKGSGLDGGKGPSKIWPHHDDLVSVTPSVNINSPFATILKEAERLAKAATTSLDFHRPDHALQEYVMASIIAAEIIPRHKDYPTLQSDRENLHRAYIALTKRIAAQDSKFAEVKQMIKANNAAHGTCRAGIMEAAAVQDSQVANGAVNNALSSNASITTPSPKKKPPPPVQPKPDALHGNSIHASGSKLGDEEPVDLAARFARLRTPEANVAVQDPRIRTQPIVVPPVSKTKSPTSSTLSNGNSTMAKLSGPRDMPSVPKTVPGASKLSLKADLPLLPRAPDAIYSPARSTETAATHNLPSSIQHAKSFHGHGKEYSAPPISTVGPTPSQVEKSDYFSPAPSSKDSSQSRTSKNFKLSLPTSGSVTAEDLMKYLGQGSQGVQVLLVDLRSREEFDSGHILSQSIICVEPITLQRGMSGQELEDSMVIAPDIEQRLFEQRNTFDLVVMYDQSSTFATAKGSQTKLQEFATAVYEYGYEKKIKHYPAMLEGGLNAWVDLLGPNSLETSSTGSVLKPTITNGGKRARPISSMPMARDLRVALLKKRKHMQSRPLSQEEEIKWASALQADQENGAYSEGGSESNELVYARTTEDFFRRYPELPSIQESMVSATPKKSVHPIEAELASTMPNPPTRPPPALPRQRSSGISDRTTLVAHAHSMENWDNLNSNARRTTPGLTGLNNPGTLCYMNSSLQALSHTPGFRNLLIPPVPRRDSEPNPDPPGQPPQLMAKALKNIFTHLWSGNWDFVNPRTLAAYVNALHSKELPNNPQGAFGGRAVQHDSEEFFRFIIGKVDDELNPRRDRPGFSHEEKTFDQEQIMAQGRYRTTLEAAQPWWDYQMENEQSMIATTMTPVTVHVTVCSNCNRPRRRFVPQPGMLVLTINPFNLVQISLGGLLRGTIELGGEEPGYSGQEEIRDAAGMIMECDYCNYENPNLQVAANGNKPRFRITESRHWIAFFPDILSFYFSRFTWVDIRREDANGNRIGIPDYQPFKTLTHVQYEEHMNFDYCHLPNPNNITAGLSRQLVGPFNYDVYSVTYHVGSKLQYGHYYTYARDPEIPGSPWYQFNDTRVSKADFKEFSQNRNHHLVCIFMKRRQNGHTNLGGLLSPGKTPN